MQSFLPSHIYDLEGPESRYYYYYRVRELYRERKLFSPVQNPKYLKQSDTKSDRNPENPRPRVLSFFFFLSFYPLPSFLEFCTGQF